MIYFAYGPDMNPARMMERSPGHRSLGVARLADHWFAFPRYSPSDRSAAISLVHSPGGVVWGVLYEVPDEDAPILNHLHGCIPEAPAAANEFNLQTVSVLCPPRPQPVAAATYVAVPDNRNPQPSAAYLALILDGARYHGLPKAYCAALQSVRTVS